MRRVRWTGAAQDDLDAAIDFIAEDSPAAAGEVLARLIRAADDLGAFSTGRHGEVRGTFEKVVLRTSHLLVYGIDERRNEIVILRVMHMARDWPGATG